MGKAKRFLSELSRRNVGRAAVLYIGAGWALAQGIAQLAPALGLPESATRWFLVAAAIGFPFWLVFAWLFELTPEGFRREREVAAEDSIARSTGRRLDFAIIAVLAVAVVLLLADRLAPPGGETGLAAKSIAVLPFENLSDDRDGEYFVVGMQNEILTRLANSGDLKVVSRTSTEKYRSHTEDLREVARALGVTTIVEGSVQRAGNQVRIAVQLIDARTDTHLWAQSYDRDLRDVFAVQSDVAGRIASALELTLQPGEALAFARAPTGDPVAYDLFLRAEYLAGRGGVNLEAEPLRQAVEAYRRAIDRDPSFALALARLSYAQSILVWLDAEGIDAAALSAEARANAERARTLDPTLADAYIALGFSAYYGNHQDYDAALAAFATAQRLRPNDAAAMAAAGYVYRRQGRIADAIGKLEEALDHDPRNTRFLTNLAASYTMVRRYGDAEAALRRAVAIDPDNLQARGLLSDAILSRTGDAALAATVLQGDHPHMQLQRVTLLWYQRRYPEALALLESVPDTPDFFESYGGYSKAVQLASLYGFMGDAAESRRHYVLAETGARRALAEAEASGPPRALFNARLSLADIELGLGRREEALRLADETQALLNEYDDRYLSLLLTAGNVALYASAGRADLAVPLLDGVLGAADGGLAYSAALLPLEPVLDPIREDPRFIALLEKYPASHADASGDRRPQTSIPVEGAP